MSYTKGRLVKKCMELKRIAETIQNEEDAKRHRNFKIALVVAAAATLLLWVIL